MVGSIKMMTERAKVIESTKSKVKPIMTMKKTKDENKNRANIFGEFVKTIDPRKSKVKATIKQTKNGLMIIGNHRKN